MNTAIRHIIWDWNGTLFDDAKLCHEITREQVELSGAPSPSIEQMQRAFTHPVKSIYKRLGADFEKRPFEILAADFFASYQARVNKCSVRPEAKPLFQRLKCAGLSHSVLSAIKHETLMSSISSSPLDGLFERALGLEDHFAVSKIENGKTLLAELDIPPQKVLVVGDTTHDLETAIALGAHVVLIPSGYQHQDILRQASAPLLGSLSELEWHLQREHPAS